MANEIDPTTEEPEDGNQQNPPSNDGGQQNPPDDEGLKDKHGEDAINRGRYDRDMKAKDDQIAQLTKQLEEANGKAKSGEDALKKITELEARLEDEKVSNALKLAGCVNEKAAKAILGDYEGDVGKLAEACPYLFGGSAEGKQKGSTGAKHHGAPGAEKDEDADLDRIFGLK
ncbi:MAG: hypothetical protein IKG69_11800 [Atopobiaceae bacterium]|nr:hypothetical protein [Atopobiaceae bacterium]